MFPTALSTNVDNFLSKSDPLHVVHKSDNILDKLRQNLLTAIWLGVYSSQCVVKSGWKWVHGFCSRFP